MGKNINSSTSYNGHLDCLKYAHENGCPLDEETYYYAEEYGSIVLLKYLDD